MNVMAPETGVPIPNFHELGMRQPGRVDVRNAPGMASSPASCGKTPNNCEFLRDFLQVLCNPTEGAPHAAGNWGRWNFEDAGPCTPKQPLVAATAGCVMSLPGAGDQLVRSLGCCKPACLLALLACLLCLVCFLGFLLVTLLCPCADPSCTPTHPICTNTLSCPRTT